MKSLGRAYLVERTMRYGFDYFLDLLSLTLNHGAVGRFCRDFGRYTERRYILPLNSGTSANEAAIFGLGLEPGAEVICPAAAPIFVSLAVFAAGAIPVFADVNPRTLIPGSDDIRQRLGPQTRAIVAVHQFGQPAPMKEIMALAKTNGLKVVEDCAQAHASFYGDGKVGTLGDVMCSSLQRSKHLTSCEGGFIATDDPDIYRRGMLYSNAGMPTFGYGMQQPEPDLVDGFRVRGHLSFGHNHRMSDYQAAVACGRLKRLKSFLSARRKNIEALEDVLRTCRAIKLAHRPEGTTTNYWQYPVQLDPAHTQATAADIVDRVLAILPRAPITAHNEVNYLERVFQDIERTRLGPHGQPIPPNVHYTIGSCPKAEASVRLSMHINVHHTIPASFLRRVASTIRRVAEE